jgi:hypothetical protein
VKVYELEVLDGYEWVVPIEKSDFEIFRGLDGTSRSRDWKPVAVRLVKQDDHGRPLKESDFPWLGKHAPVMKPRAIESLRSTLVGDGEFLPLRCDEIHLALFNVTRVLDALDESRSRVVKFASTDRIMKIKSYVFRPQAIGDVNAFKIPQLLRGPVFLSGSVVEQATSSGLSGIDFHLVWSA